jgi:hypothetical protein
VKVKLIAELPTPFHDADERNGAAEKLFEPAGEAALHKVRWRLFVLQKLLVDVQCEDVDLIVASVGFELPEEIEDPRRDSFLRSRNRFVRDIVLILALMFFVVAVVLASILMLLVVVQILLRELLKRRCRGGCESATGRSADARRAGVAQIVCS